MRISIYWSRPGWMTLTAWGIGALLAASISLISYGYVSDGQAVEDAGSTMLAVILFLGLPGGGGYAVGRATKGKSATSTELARLHQQVGSVVEVQRTLAGQVVAVADQMGRCEEQLRLIQQSMPGSRVRVLPGRGNGG